MKFWILWGWDALIASAFPGMLFALFFGALIVLNPDYK
jgi:hypothetical protein